MNKIYKLLAVFSFLFITISCYKDLGNYDYTTVPKIKITTKDTVYMTQFDTLKLAVEVDLDGRPASDYEYSWRIWSDAIGNTEIKDIGMTKDLEYLVKEVPGSYSLVLICKNKVTDVNVYKNVKLLVQGIISEGWMVLQEKNGKTDFDLIMTPFISNRFKKDVILPDLYESVNGVPLEGRGVKISNYYSLGRYQYVVILTEDGGVRLNAITMQKTYDIPTLMYDKKPLKPQNYFYFSYYWAFARGNEVIISDGRYYINELLGTGYTEPILKNGESYVSSIYAPKWLWMYKGIIYDELNGRFLGIQQPLLTAVKLPDAVGRRIDWNKTNASLKYMDTGFKRFEYGLMQDWTTKKFSLHAYDFDLKNDFDMGLYSADACPELSSAKHYAIGDRGNVFYYATEKDIYLYDYAGTNTAKKVYTVATGEKITSMKILKSCLDRIVPTHPFDNKVLILSTHNDQTAEGKVYMYYINEGNGAMDLSSEKVFGGFGKIIDMDYNFPKYGT